MHALDAIFSPQSVAVVGASTTPGKVGHDIFANILRGGYTRHPLSCQSQRQIDFMCARLSVGKNRYPRSSGSGHAHSPPALALEAVKEAVPNRGLRGLSSFRPDFREVGPERGAEIENRIVAMCQEAGIRLVGPNCLGVINPHAEVRLNASFSARMPKPGKHLLYIPKRRLVYGRSRFCRRPGLRVFKVYLHRQQGRCGRTGSIALSARGPEHRGHHDLPGRTAPGTGICRNGKRNYFRLSQNAGVGDQIRPDHGRRGGGRLAYRCAGRIRSGLRRDFQANRYHPGGINPRAFSILRAPLPTKRRAPSASCAERFPTGTGWPSSPMPVDRESWPPT